METTRRESGAGVMRADVDDTRELVGTTAGVAAIDSPE